MNANCSRSGGCRGAEVRISIKKQQKKAEAEQSRTESKLRKQVDMYEDRNVILERKVKEL